MRGSAGAGIGIYKKHLDAPAVTFDSVTLVDTGRLDKGVLFSWGAPGYPVHVTPIMLMDNDGGLGGLWFENVVVVMGPQHSPARPFLSYNQWPCDPGIPCPNVTGAIGGRIEVQWRDSAAQCVPRLLGEGGAPLPNGTLFGHEDVHLVVGLARLDVLARTKQPQSHLQSHLQSQLHRQLHRHR